MNAMMKAAGTLVLAASAFSAHADLKIGVVVSETGGGASLGIPAHNTIKVLPPTLGGQKVNYIVLNDASDTTQAVRQARKLVEEDHVDAIIGPSLTPTSLAMLEVIGPGQTPMFSLAGSGVIAVPQEGHRRWAFKLAPNESTMGDYIFDNLEAAHRKTIAYIAYSNSYGEAFVKEIDKVRAKRGLSVVADERYSPTDTSVSPQVLKVISAHPDAVFLAVVGSTGALPVIELRKRGYKGLIYMTQGIASPDFVRVGGRDVDGVMFPVSPALVAEQLPDANPVKKVAMDYVTTYENKWGAGTRSLFGAAVWDSYVLLDNAVPVALKTAQPGTPAFRTALRDALEHTGEVVGAEGVFNMTPTDHIGNDRRALVLVKIEQGKWVLIKDIAKGK